MSKKKNKQQKTSENTFTKRDVHRKRRFPIKNTVLLVAIICVQIFLILFALFGVSVAPQDIINSYSITVVPQDDGALNLNYSFNWTAVDASEKLTWVDIGMPNSAYSVDENSLSDNIKSFTQISDEGYVALRIYFTDSYSGGDNFDFSFSVIQNNMLCKNEKGYFYEFIPSWFNRIPVEKYSVRWLASENIDNDRYIVDDEGYILWQGSSACGEYLKIFVQYNSRAFNETANISSYIPFDGSGVYNELNDDAKAQKSILFLFAIILAFFEVHIFDCYVSYVRGRGFLRNYGQYVHLYGGINPIHRRLNTHYNNPRINRIYRRGGGSGISSGCACACACACAGGGRAGCSQKDTYSVDKKIFVKK